VKHNIKVHFWQIWHPHFREKIYRKNSKNLHFKHPKHHSKEEDTHTNNDLLFREQFASPRPPRAFFFFFFHASLSSS